MKTTIFYFSGTGNSLKVSQYLAEKLGNTDIIPINSIINKEGKITIEADRVGIVFPVIIWGLPKIICRFIKKLSAQNKDVYFFSAAATGGNVAGSLLQLSKLLSSQGFSLSVGVSLALPSSFIANFDSGSVEDQKKLFVDAKLKLNTIAEIINLRAEADIEKGTLKERIFKSGLVYRMLAPFIPTMDKFFMTDENCTACGFCQKICPVDCIELKNGKPVWKHKCELCFRCINYCPKSSIQYGKLTAGKNRYKNPLLSINEIVKG